MKKESLKKDKKAIEMDMLAWLIIGLVVLAIVFIGIAILNGKATSAVQYIKDLLKFKTGA